LINKKVKTELKTQNQEELFLQDYQQKLQTLLAISLQIEQLLLDFVESPSVNFRKNLKTAVDKYTRNYGRFLTEFVVANEKYFNELEKSEISDLINKRDYEKIIRINSKNIGLESMKLIEQLQTWKKPNKKDLARMETKIIQKFEALKGSLNQRIIEMTEDRTR
jgi:transposase